MQGVSIFDNKERSSIAEIYGFTAEVVALSSGAVVQMEKITTDDVGLTKSDLELVMFCLKAFVDNHEVIKNKNPQQTNSIQENLRHIPILTQKVTNFAKEKGYSWQFAGDEWYAKFLGTPIH